MTPMLKNLKINEKQKGGDCLHCDSAWKIDASLPSSRVGGLFEGGGLVRGWGACSRVGGLFEGGGLVQTNG